MSIQLAPEYRDHRLYGYTYQYTTTGKNLLDTNNFTTISNQKGITISKNADGTFNITGTSTSTGTIFIGNDFANRLINGHTYSAYLGGAEYGDNLNLFCHLKYENKDDNSINIIPNNANQKIKTDKWGTLLSAQFRLYIGSVGIVYDYHNLKIMIAEGTSFKDKDWEYEPFTDGISPNDKYPQEILTLTGDNTIDICTGKNILNIDKLNFKNGYYSNTGVWNNANNNGTIEFIEVEPNTTYTISLNTSISIFGICEFDISKTFINRLQHYNLQKWTFLTNSNTKYLAMIFNLDSSTKITKEMITSWKPQLELGSIETDYEPCKYETYPISLGSMEVCAIGNNKDYIYKEVNDNKWYKFCTIGKIVFNGTENWRSEGTNDANKKRFSYDITDSIQSDTSHLNSFNSHFSLLDAGGTYNVSYGTGYTFGNNKRIYIRHNEINTLVDYKNWLATHNVSVYYVLDKPITIEITDPVLLSQLNNLDKRTTEKVIQKKEIDWTESMEQTFEYYEVDPNTWKDTKLIENVKSCTIKRDSGADTLGSATINIADTLGECYIRIYLLAIQNGVKKRVCLGTYLVQTPSSSFDGKQRNVSMDAYTPLLELKEKPVPLGYTLLKNDNIMEEACKIVKDNCRAPVVVTTSDEQLKENFVASTDDTWLTYIIDLIKQANFQFYLDEQGQILFEPSKTAEELSPVYTFNDDNSSILHPNIDLTHDLYNVPNVVEIYAPNGNNVKYYRAENRDNTSPTSIQNRGREIIYRETEPNLPAYPTDSMVEEYAKNTLKRLSSVQYSVSYTHGYCPVRVGDCVRLNYSKAGLTNIKAKVTTQSIRCTTGCEVSETAVFTKKLWE